VRLSQLASVDPGDHGLICGNYVPHSEPAEVHSNGAVSFRRKWIASHEIELSAHRVISRWPKFWAAKTSPPGRTHPARAAGAHEAGARPARPTGLSEGGGPWSTGRAISIDDRRAFSLAEMIRHPPQTWPCGITQLVTHFDHLPWSGPGPVGHRLMSYRSRIPKRNLQGDRRMEQPRL
jgi:hypothetical protein